MMTESAFNRLADEWLNRAADVLEEADAAGALELEYADGVLTLELPSGPTLVISKHRPMRQLWLASPVSGGLHFSHNGTDWALADGRTLTDTLRNELDTLAGIKMQW